MRLILIFSLLLFCFELAAKTTSIHLKREDGSNIEGYLSAPDHVQSYPLVIFIDGSHEASVTISHHKLAERLNAHKIGIVSLEKRGISTKKVVRDEYLKHDCFEERLQDYVLLLKAIEEKKISQCNSNCIVLGGSEGGKIAPRLVHQCPNNIMGLILIGSGGGLSFAEEMKYQSQQLIQQFDSLKQLAYKTRGMLLPNEQEALYAKMLASPDSLEMCGPKTWKWWASYLRYDLLSDLMNITVPIYMIHGEQDIMVPIKSADLVKEAFDKVKKSNLTFARYTDLGHALAGREDVYAAMFAWIQAISNKKDPTL